MKKHGWIFILLLTSFIACKNDPKDKDVDQGAAVTEQPQDPNAPSSTPRGTAAPAINPGDSPEVRLLTNNFWVVEHWVNRTNDRQVYLANKGRWWNFKPDGTFETGIWQEKLTQGSWRIFRQDGETIVYVDAEDDNHDGQWAVQFNGPGTESSWVGSSDYVSSAGIMTKLDNLLTMPTKEQYGVQ